MWQQVSGQLNDILTVHFGLAGTSLSPDLRLDEDLALDSLDLVDFGMVLQYHFQIELGIEVLRLARTISDLTSLITAGLADRGTLS